MAIAPANSAIAARKSTPRKVPEDFAYAIHAEENAPGLLRRAMSRAPGDLVMTGDDQPAERRFELSRTILQVCYELGFPVAVLEQSPLGLRNLELLQDINDWATAVTVLGVICTPDSPGYERERFPDLLEGYERLYREASDGAAGWDWKRFALRLRELCEQ